MYNLICTLHVLNIRIRTHAFVYEFQRNDSCVHLKGDETARFEICEYSRRAYLHARDRRAHACVYMEPREERQRSETPYRHADFLRRMLAWPPMMMTRTETVVVVVNANDDGWRWW